MSQINLQATLLHDNKVSMQAKSATSKPNLGPYKPTLIIHGGAGVVMRSMLPPALYEEYKRSLLSYVASTQAQLQAGGNALDAACHAVTLLEDDPLFNCGRGSVFTRAGTIEMEASVMVTTIERADTNASHVLPQTKVKRGAAVSMLTQTKNPILLAREVLSAGGDGFGGLDSMHCHLAGEEVEEWGWKQKGLERVTDGAKEGGWFWTERRWREHLRGLESDHGVILEAGSEGAGAKAYARALKSKTDEVPSQGTVGAVCLDSWGNLAVATSTGGLTNKLPGRIGDTPTVGSGFWAESWDELVDEEDDGQGEAQSRQPAATKAPGAAIQALSKTLTNLVEYWLPDYVSFMWPQLHPAWPTGYGPLDTKSPSYPVWQPQNIQRMSSKREKNEEHDTPPRRAVAMSGTGNGDSFVRVNAVRTAAAMSRFAGDSLEKAVAMVAGPGGELQVSAGERWEKTPEGQGGIIGIEVRSHEGSRGLKGGTVVLDFNCRGMWRAWIDNETGESRIMVFRKEYEEYGDDEDGK